MHSILHRSYSTTANIIRIYSSSSQYKSDTLLLIGILANDRLLILSGQCVCVLRYLVVELFNRFSALRRCRRFGCQIDVAVDSIVLWLYVDYANSEWGAAVLVTWYVRRLVDCYHVTINDLQSIKSVQIKLTNYQNMVYIFCKKKTGLFFTEI